MSYQMYHNGKTFCCAHEDANSYFVIYNSSSPYDDENTKYKTIIKPKYGRASEYLDKFLFRLGYEKI